ncbi:hypothetical protein PMAYCL1PPCAC_09148, partial [Pristionchus mayeri]
YIFFQPKSQFRSAFYWLFVAAAVVDLLNIINCFPEFRWAVYPLTNGAGMIPDMFAKIRNYITFVCPVTQDFLNAFIAFGRVTAIAMPTRHNLVRSL